MEKAWGSLIAQNRGLCQTLSKEPDPQDLLKILDYPFRPPSIPAR